ncbi:MAG: YHS domain-containing protein [Candidatus Hodarchaeales archaeon]|jgi:YHS domain-containing protein
MRKCPVCGMMVDEKTSPTSSYKGTTYYFHKPVHKDMFDKEPEKFLDQQSDSTGMKI